MKGQLAAVVIDQWRAAGVRIGRFFSTFWAPDRPSILQSSRLWFDLAADLDPLMAAASCKTSTWRLLHLGVQLLFGQSMSPARRPHCQWSVCVSSHIAIDFCNFHWPTADTLLIVTTSSFIKASESPAAAEKKTKESRWKRPRWQPRHFCKSPARNISEAFICSSGGLMCTENVSRRPDSSARKRVWLDTYQTPKRRKMLKKP